MRRTISWSLLVTVYWSRDEDGIGVCAFECTYVYYAPPWLRGRLHLVRHAASKSLVLQYRWHWSTLVQRIKEKEMDKKGLLTKTFKCYKTSNFLWKNELAESIFWLETNFCWVFLEKGWISWVYLEPSRSFLMKFFCENS